MHGEAVALGIVLAARLSKSRGWIDDEIMNRITTLLETAGLATTPPAVEKEKLLDAIGHDKKASSAGLRLIAIDSLGSAFVFDELTRGEFEAFLDENLHGHS